MIFAAAIGFWTWISVIGAALFGLYLLNKQAFRRAKDAAGAQVGKAGRALWGYDPIAVKNAEIDRKAEELAEATAGLVNCRSLVSGVERKISDDTKEVNRLQALAEQYVTEGNDTKAREKLTSKEEIDGRLERNRSSLQRHRETYESWLAKITAANKRINELRGEAKEQGVRLKMAKAEESLAKLGPAIGKSNLSFDSLDEVNEEIESQIENSEAKGKVVHDLAKEGLEEIEAEKRVSNKNVDAALEKIKSKMNGTVVHDPK